MNAERKSKTTSLDTRQIVRQMFVNLVKMDLEPRMLDQIAPVVDGLLARLEGSIATETPEGLNRLKIALCGMLSHGWALGMNPYNNPDKTVDDRNIEVRVSKDILVPMDVLKSLLYVKKDPSGRVQRALFEPNAEEKAREQIDRILGEICTRCWKDEDPPEDPDQ